MGWTGGNWRWEERERPRGGWTRGRRLGMGGVVTSTLFPGRARGTWRTRSLLSQARSCCSLEGAFNSRLNPSRSTRVTLLGDRLAVEMGRKRSGGYPHSRARESLILPVSSVWEALPETRRVSPLRALPQAEGRALVALAGVAQAPEWQRSRVLEWESPGRKPQAWH